MQRNQLIEREEFLHWIWKELHFDTSVLKTRCGARITIFDPGELNESDGPDFLHASLQINHLFWHGDVELHLKEGDWFRHKHHQDPNYNSVILHIILYDDQQPTAHRADKTRPFTLRLTPYIKSNLLHFLKAFNKSDHRRSIPCNRHPDQILREDLFQRQLKQAHRSYFYQKIFDLYAYWDHQMQWHQAWKRMLTIAVFDGLGIRHNRTSMTRLARLLFELELNGQSEKEIIKKAYLLAGFDQSRQFNQILSGKLPCFNWNRKGVRPHNRPEPRIRQAIRILKNIQSVKMIKFLEADPYILWFENVGGGFIDGLGKHRSNILYGITFLPALKIAADMSDRRKRGNRIRQKWNDHQVRIPSYYTNILDKTSINRDIYKRQLGTVYQLRNYCLQHRCRECLVFQKAFSS